MITRYYHQLIDLIPPNKALIIYGPRRIGKTTLIQETLRTTHLKYKLDSGDNFRTREILGSEDFTLIGEYLQGYELYVIDEAQNIANIGKALKIIVDQFPTIKLIATGSSSFAIQQQVGEPLTGRKRELMLFPLAQLELQKELNRFELKENLAQFLIFGSYPEVYTTKSKEGKMELLNDLVNSYLLKDILGFDRLKNPSQLMQLLKLLAFQVGSEVSYNELAKKTGLNVRTVTRYIDLLEKGFVIYGLGAYSKNLRKEVSKMNKFFFFDNGVRNAVINNFNNLEDRNDVGQLWENFIITERMKFLSYNKYYVNTFFWRNYAQKEIDYLEESNGEITPYEIKYKKANTKLPKEFSEAYPSNDLKTITKENYLDFIIE